MRDTNSSSVGVIAESAMEKLNIPIAIEIEETSLKAVLGSIQSVTITELKNAKASHYASPLTALNTLKLPNIVGVAKLSLPIGEDHADSIKAIAFNIS